MDKERAKEEIRERWREIITRYTEPAKRTVEGKTTYICPFCGHGKGGDGLKGNPKSKGGYGLKCFGCDFTGDIIDLIKQVDGKNYPEALEAAADILGITIDPYRQTAAADFRTAGKATQAPQRANREKAEQTPTETAESPQTDTEALEAIIKYIGDCSNRITGSPAEEYLKGRGITPGMINFFELGFDPSYKGRPALVIPYPNADYYTVRILNYDGKGKYKNIDGVPVPLFTAGNEDSDFIMICEGQLDALSLIQAGADYVAAIGGSGTSRLDSLKGVKRAAIIADNDNAGENTAIRISEKLAEKNIKSIIFHPPEGYKDSNDLLKADPGRLADLVKRWKAEAIQATQKPDSVANYIQNRMGADLEKFNKEIKTGFIGLDEISGGLYPGLYVVAAVSSLGKTTFTHQIADQVATAGHDVLFFSLEQSRLELVTKSISRYMAKKDTGSAVTSLAIRKGYMPEPVKEAAKAYMESIGDRLSIIEGNFNCDVDYMAKYINAYMDENAGTKPLVIVDYMQVVTPPKDFKGGTKEAIDYNVTALKRLSRDLDLTVILISSVNRANYLSPIDFESLKESGSLEFTADVVLGLQLRLLNEPAFIDEKAITKKREMVKKAKLETPRKIELVCLKNRYGKSSYSCLFDYYPAVDLFTEAIEAAPILPAARKRV